MKKLVIISLITLTALISMYSQTFRGRTQTSYSNAPLELVHEIASGYRTITYSEPGPRRDRNSSGTRKVTVNMQERVEALTEIGIRKDAKSIPVVCSAVTDGLATRYSRTGLPGNRENLPPQMMIQVRLAALKTLMNFATPTEEAQKMQIKETLKTSFFEEWDERVRATTCAAMVLHKSVFTDSEQDLLNAHFRREVMRIITANQFRLLSSMYNVTDAFSRKSGISFLDMVLISGIRGKYYHMAMRLKQKLTVYGK